MLVGVLSFAQAIHGPKQKNKEVLSVECCALVISARKNVRELKRTFPKSDQATHSLPLTLARSKPCSSRQTIIYPFLSMSSKSRRECRVLQM